MLTVNNPTKQIFLNTASSASGSPPTSDVVLYTVPEGKTMTGTIFTSVIGSTAMSFKLKLKDGTSTAVIVASGLSTGFYSTVVPITLVAGTSILATPNGVNVIGVES